MKTLMHMFLVLPVMAISQPYENGEVFIGETISDSKKPVYLGDSMVFYVSKNEHFYCRYSSYKNTVHITMADGRNGESTAENIIRSLDQTFFKITYPSHFFPFTKTHSIYGASMYSNCSYQSVAYWQTYFSDTLNFIALSERAFHKDTSALFQLLSLNKLDCDGFGQWAINNWKLLNAFSDKEIAVFLFNRISKNEHRGWSHSILPYNVQTPVFGDESQSMLRYYEKHYPLVYEIYKLENEDKYSNFIKHYRKIKRLLSAVN